MWVENVYRTACWEKEELHPPSPLLEQAYRDIEVIVVDDASNDDTGDVMRALAASGGFADDGGGHRL